MDKRLESLLVAHVVLGGFSIAFSILLLIQTYFLWCIAPGNLTEPVPGAFKLVGATTLVMAIIGFIYGILLKICGKCFEHRKNRKLILITSAIGCTQWPFGPMLSIPTLITLFKADVKELFSD